MEKITKEELLEKFGGVPLSDDELEKVSGGYYDFMTECENMCIEQSNNSFEEDTCLKQFCQDN